MCGLFSPNFFSFSFFFLFEKRPKKKKESKEERSPAVFFVCVFGILRFCQVLCRLIFV